MLPLGLSHQHFIVAGAIRGFKISYLARGFTQVAEKTSFPPSVVNLPSGIFVFYGCFIGPCFCNDDQEVTTVRS